jgi:hypothetical protein
VESEPTQVLVNRVTKFRAATGRIEIFDAQHQLPVAVATPLLCPPKRDRVTDMQVTGGRRREPAAVKVCRHLNRIEYVQRSALRIVALAACNRARALSIPVRTAASLLVF